MPKRPYDSAGDDDASFLATFSNVSLRTQEIDKRSESAETSASVLSFFDAEVRSLVSTEQRQQPSGQNPGHYDRGERSERYESDGEHDFSEQEKSDEENSSIEEAGFDESHDELNESDEEVCYREETKRAEQVAKEFERMVTRGVSARTNESAKDLKSSRSKLKLRKDLKQTDKELPSVNSLLENLLRESREKQQLKTNRPMIAGVDGGILSNQFACDFDNAITASVSKRVKVGKSISDVAQQPDNNDKPCEEKPLSDRPPAAVEQFVPRVNQLSMVTELYGFQYNLESVFITDCVLCLEVDREPERVSVLVIRDRLGVENYWFPARRLLHLCGFLNLRRTVKHRCPPNSAKRFSELRRMYNIKSFDLGGNHIYLNEEGINGIFYGSRFRENIARIDLVRVGVVHFYRARRFVVGELIKQVANEYIQWSLPPV